MIGALGNSDDAAQGRWLDSDDLPERGDTVTIRYESSRSGNIIEKTGWSGGLSEDGLSFPVDVDSKGEQVLRVKLINGRVVSEASLHGTDLGSLESFSVEGDDESEVVCDGGVDELADTVEAAIQNADEGEPVTFDVEGTEFTIARSNGRTGRSEWDDNGEEATMWYDCYSLETSGRSFGSVGGPVDELVDRFSGYIENHVNRPSAAERHKQQNNRIARNMARNTRSGRLGYF